MPTIAWHPDSGAVQKIPAEDVGNFLRGGWNICDLVVIPRDQALALAKQALEMRNEERKRELDAALERQILEINR